MKRVVVVLLGFFFRFGYCLDFSEEKKLTSILIRGRHYFEELPHEILFLTCQNIGIFQ